MLVTLRGNETAVFCWFYGNLTTPAAGRRGVWMWLVASLRQQLAIYIQMCARHKGKGLGNRYAVQYLWSTLMILTDLCIFAAFHFCQTAEPGNEPCFSVRRERVSNPFAFSCDWRSCSFICGQICHRLFTFIYLSIFHLQLKKIVTRKVVNYNKKLLSN